MTSPTVVALLFGSGVQSGQQAALATERSQLEQLIDASEGGLEIRVVSRGIAESPISGAMHIELGNGAPGPLDRLLRAVGGNAIRARFATFPLGRLLNSMGPLDPGRVFWRAVRRNPAAVEAVRGSDAVFAADLAGVKTAWIAVRRGWAAEGRYDHRASALRR